MAFIFTIMYIFFSPVLHDDSIECSMYSLYIFHQEPFVINLNILLSSTVWFNTVTCGIFHGSHEHRDLPDPARC